MASIDEYFQNKYQTSVPPPKPVDYSSKSSIDDYFTKKYATQDPSISEKLLADSKSPFKLSGPTVLKADTRTDEDYYTSALDGTRRKIGLGFVGRAAFAAGRTAKNTIESAATNIDELFNTVTAKDRAENPNGTDYTKVTGQTIGMTPEERQAYYEGKQKEGSALNKTVALGKVGVSAINFIPGIAQFSAEMAAAKELPGPLSWPAKAVDKGIGKLGQLGSYTLGKSVDVLPVSDETKTTMKSLTDELGPAIAIYLGFKAAHGGAETIDSKLVDKLNISKEAKAKINNVVKTTVGLSMNPFSTAYGKASQMIAQKTYERGLEKDNLNPEDAKKIIEEIRNELPSELDKIKVESIEDTTTKINNTNDRLDKSEESVKKVIEEKQTEEQLKDKTTEEGYDIIQEKIDKMIDENMTQGMDFLKASDTPEVNKLYKLRNEFTNHDIEALKDSLRKKIPAPEKVTEEIIKYELQIKDGENNGDWYEVISNATKKFLDPENATEIKTDIVKKLLKERNLEEGVFGNDSGLTESGQKALRNELGKQSNEIYDVIKDTILEHKPGKATDVLLKNKKINPNSAIVTQAIKETEKPKQIETKKPIPPEAAKTKESTKEDAEKSRVYERLQEEYPDILKDVVGYDAIKLKEQAEKAVELIKTDKEKAYRIAMGAEVSSEITSTAVNIAMADAALKNGNYELFNQLTKIRSLEQTRRGQEIVSEKGSVSDNSTARYVKELINAKMNELGKNYLGTLKDDILFKKQTNGKKATDIIKKEVAKAKEKTQIKEMDIQEAQSFLDKLACA